MLGPYVPFYSEDMPNTGRSPFSLSSRRTVDLRSFGRLTYLHTYLPSKTIPPHTHHTRASDHWIYEESLLNPWYRFYVTTHMCSYICWQVAFVVVRMTQPTAPINRSHTPNHHISLTTPTTGRPRDSIPRRAVTSHGNTWPTRANTTEKRSVWCGARWDSRSFSYL